MARLAKALLPLALMLACCATAFGQGAPITLERLNEALGSKLLGDKEIAEIVLEVGVSFRLTDELEGDLRGRGASDLVILAVRNGFRPPLPPGPASAAAIAEALERGASSVDIVAHVEQDGLQGTFNADLLARLRTAGASPILQGIIASRWLGSNALDGSLEQIEALLAAGVEAAALSAKLADAQVTFSADREAFARLSSAGANPVVLRAIAGAFVASAGKPFSLDQLVVLQGAGVGPSALAGRIAEVGTDFEKADDVAQQLASSGLDEAIANAVLARRIGAGAGPLTLRAIVGALRGNVPAPEMIQAIQTRGVAFRLTNDVAAGLASFPPAVRLACAVQALGQQGYRAYRPSRAAGFNPDAEQGTMDIRLTVDHVEDVVVIDDVLIVKALRGADSEDIGSEATQPLPMDLDPNTFAVELKDGRGQIAAYWSPEKGNGYIMRARVFDEKGGADKYHLRLSWRRGGVNAGGTRRQAPSLLK